MDSITTFLTNPVVMPILIILVALALLESTFKMFKKYGTLIFALVVVLILGYIVAAKLGYINITEEEAKKQVQSMILNIPSKVAPLATQEGRQEAYKGIGDTSNDILKAIDNALNQLQESPTVSYNTLSESTLNGVVSNGELYCNPNTRLKLPTTPLYIEDIEAFKVDLQQKGVYGMGNYYTNNYIRLCYNGCLYMPIIEDIIEVTIVSLGNNMYKLKISPMVTNSPCR